VLVYVPVSFICLQLTFSSHSTFYFLHLNSIFIVSSAVLSFFPFLAFSYFSFFPPQTFPFPVLLLFPPLFSLPLLPTFSFPFVTSLSPATPHTTPTYRTSHHLTPSPSTSCRHLFGVPPPSDESVFQDAAGDLTHLICYVVSYVVRCGVV
jgi:hypothetical protein